jgi:hypothetical protein
MFERISVPEASRFNQKAFENALEKTLPALEKNDAKGFLLTVLEWYKISTEDNESERIRHSLDNAIKQYKLQLCSKPYCILTQYYFSDINSETDFKEEAKQHQDFSKIIEEDRCYQLKEDMRNAEKSRNGDPED